MHGPIGNFHFHPMVLIFLGVMNREDRPTQGVYRKRLPHRPKGDDDLIYGSGWEKPWL